jgi:hypothetical protein
MVKHLKLLRFSAFRRNFHPATGYREKGQFDQQVSRDGLPLTVPAETGLSSTSHCSFDIFLVLELSSLSVFSFRRR